MSTRLPEFIHLRHGEKPVEKVFNGVIPLARLPRLQQSSEGDGTTAATVALVLKVTGHRHMLVGKTSITLAMRCQRCLEKVNITLASEVKLELFTDEHYAEKVTEGYEPIIAKDGVVSVRDVIEDELLLALPLVAKHDVGECQIDSALLNQQVTSENETNNPFKSLKIMMTDDKKQSSNNE